MSSHRQRPEDFPDKGSFPLIGLNLLDRLCVIIITVFGIGYARKAPGTWGSLPGLAFGALLIFCSVSVLVKVLILALMTFLSLWAIGRIEAKLNIHDDSRIVVDEFVGQAIASAFLPLNPFMLLASFGLFRLLDIQKPWIIGWIDAKVPGAWGTLGDDVIAGIASALFLNIALFIIPLS